MELPVLQVANYRFCQYDLWDEEEAVIGDSLFIVIPDRMDPTDLVTLRNGQRIKKGFTPDFRSLKGLMIKNDYAECKNGFFHLSIQMHTFSGGKKLFRLS